MHNSEPATGQWCVISNYYPSQGWGVQFFDTEAEAASNADGLAKALQAMPSKPIATIRVAMVTRLFDVNDS